MARVAGVPRKRWGKQWEMWQQNLMEWSRSGKTQAEYCRRLKLNQNAFSSWKRRLGWRDEIAKPLEERSALGTGTQRSDCLESALFVPIRVEKQTTMRWQDGACNNPAPVFEVVLRNGRVLRAGLNVEVERLARLAAVMES